MRESLDCPNCEGKIVYPEGLHGEKICSNCGLVVDEKPTVQAFSQWTPEWHSNWNEQDSETLKEWLTILRAISCQLNIPNFPFREEAARTIRRTQNKILSRSQKLSKNKRITIAALMYLVLQEYDKSRPIKDISEELSLDNRAVTKHVWLLKESLSLKEEKVVRIQRKTALDYFHEYCGLLTCNKEVIEHAESIIIKIRRAGGNPIGVAAGAIYSASKLKKAKISKEEIGKVFHISPRTVYSNEERIRRILVSAI